LFIIYAESKTGIEGRKKEGALNHTLKRHRQEPEQRYERMRPKGIRSSTATAPIDERNFRHPVSLFRKFDGFLKKTVMQKATIK